MSCWLHQPFIHPMTTTVHLWTVQMSQWREAKKQDIYFLDITAKSGLICFAPEFSNVMRYKRGELSQEAYTQLYLERMAESKRKFPLRWASLATKSRIALACYCKAGVFCHRHLFADLMIAHLKEQGIEVIHHGELHGTKPSNQSGDQPATGALPPDDTQG